MRPSKKITLKEKIDEKGNYIMDHTKWREPNYHGTYVEMIKDRPARVEKLYQEFITEMSREFPTFEIIAQSQSEFPAGVCMYVTYRV